MDIKRLLHVLRILESIPIDYMVTGSIAAILYGKPRLTHDMDVVVVLHPRQIARFCSSFPMEEFYCPYPEALAEEIQRGDRGHFNLIDQTTGFKVDIYPFDKDPLVAWGFERRRHIELLQGEPVWVAPPEYVILKKLIYFQEGRSEKHLEDIRAMLEVSGDHIDHEVLASWVQKLRLQEEWLLGAFPP